VVEGVLGNVPNDQVGVLPDLTTLQVVGLHNTNKELDEGGSTGTVGTEDGDTGGEGDLEGDVIKLLNLLGEVLEANLAHLEEGRFLGLDTHKERRIRELELVVLSSLKGVVGLGFGDSSNELRLPRYLDLEADRVKNVSDGVVEDARIVRDDNCKAKVSMRL
jgi:hypothetical protein